MSAGGKTKKAAAQAEASAAARTALQLTLGQAVAIAEVLCSKNLSILPHRLESLSFSSLCAARAPLLPYPELLADWTHAVGIAVTAILDYRGLPPLDWVAWHRTVLAPAARKPLKTRFVLTCLDLSVNLDQAIEARTPPASAYSTSLLHTRSRFSPRTPHPARLSLIKSRMFAHDQHSPDSSAACVYSMHVYCPPVLLDLVPPLGVSKCLTSKCLTHCLTNTVLPTPVIRHTLTDVPSALAHSMHVHCPSHQPQ